MSVARYQYAGPPGTGTTTDNMASRVLAWANVVQTSAPATARSSHNISSINDAAAGDTYPAYTAPLAITGTAAAYSSGTAGGYAVIGGGSSYLSTTTNIRMLNGTVAASPVNTDSQGAMILVCGALA